MVSLDLKTLRDEIKTLQKKERDLQREWEIVSKPRRDKEREEQKRKYQQHVKEQTSKILEYANAHEWIKTVDCSKIDKKLTITLSRTFTFTEEDQFKTGWNGIPIIKHLKANYVIITREEFDDCWGPWEEILFHVKETLDQRFYRWDDGKVVSTTFDQFIDALEWFGQYMDKTIIDTHVLFNKKEKDTGGGINDT
jgi:hypothetical protein